MKKYFFVLADVRCMLCGCLGFFLSVNVFSQIVVNPGGSASSIISSFVGSGLSVSNVQLNCGGSDSFPAYGTFSNASSSLGLSQGIILTTGSANNLIGPNMPWDSASTGTGSHWGYQDPQIISIAGDSISDLCSLEFDVVPHCNSVQIKFVFGSEEYPEFVNAYNDAFGFFVTGPDGNCNPGYYNNTNVALLPDGSPISINNINNGQAAGCPLALPGPCHHCGYYINNCNGYDVEYDGFTTVFTINFSVCPCETYHWKLAIADSRDGLYDSGVMVESFSCANPLEANVTSYNTGCTCSGVATVNITSGTPPYAYHWSTGDTTQTVTGLCSGYYNVQIWDANSCNIPITRWVYVQSLTLATDQHNVTCRASDNGSATVIATGGIPPYSFAWNTNPIQTTATISNLSAGTYSVHVTDSTGCSGFISVDIYEPDTFIVHVSDGQTSCDYINGSLHANPAGGTDPLSYLWSTTPPQTGQIALGLAPGVYTVTVTDANGCTVSQSATVYPSPHITASPDTSMCEGSNVYLSVHGDNTYTWSPAAGLPSTTGSFQYAHPTVTTTYRIIGSCNGPRDTAYITVTVLPKPHITVSPPQTICMGSNVTLNASGALHYNWSPSYYITSASPDSASVNTTLWSSRTFFVQGFNSLGCTDEKTVTVNVRPPYVPIINSTGPTAFCAGSGTILFTSIAGTYLWNTGQTTASIIVTSGGTYTVTVTDVNGCTGTSLPVQTIVYPSPDPVITASGPTEICIGNPVSLDLTTGTFASYHWSTLETTPLIHVSSGGIYTVTVTDNRNCTGSATKAINIHSPFTTINTYAPSPLCEGNSALLHANTSQGMTFLWSTGSTQASILAYTTGSYTVTATDASSCSVSASQILFFNPKPDAVISPAGPLQICNGTSATLNVNTGNGYSYQWFFNSTQIQGETNSQLTTATDGNYSVEVTSPPGCSALSLVVEVTFGTRPQVSVTASPGIGCKVNTIYSGYGQQGITLTAQSTTAVSYLWSSGQTTQSISVSAPGTYSVTAYDALGCSSQQGGQSEITINTLDVRCGQNMQKVILCHVPEGNPANPQTICIAPSAVAAHLALHKYDCLGPCNQSTRLKESAAEEEMLIYPNPATEQFSIYSSQFSIQRIEVCDLLGQVVLNQQKPAGADQVPVHVEISELSSGIYFVKVNGDGREEIFKLIKE